MIVFPGVAVSHFAVILFVFLEVGFLSQILAHDFDQLGNYDSLLRGRPMA